MHTCSRRFSIYYIVNGKDKEQDLTFIKFRVFFFGCWGFLLGFWTLGNATVFLNVGNFFNSSSIFSAARFFDIFLLLPSPSVTLSPTVQVVVNT